EGGGSGGVGGGWAWGGGEPRSSRAPVPTATAGRSRSESQRREVPRCSRRRANYVGASTECVRHSWVFTTITAAGRRSKEKLWIQFVVCHRPLHTLDARVRADVSSR